MKKIRLIMLAIGILLLFAVFTSANAADFKKNEIVQAEDSNLVTLPASLTTIEDEAFEGTAITNVVLSENVESIGDYAFANIQTLRNISIPNKTTYIGKNAFKGSTIVTITGAPKGYARAWAHENGIPFRPITSFYAFNNTVQVNGRITNRKAKQFDVDIEKIEEGKPKPTGRMTGELNAEKKETITAFHIQGRSPPMV